MYIVECDLEEKCRNDKSTLMLHLYVNRVALLATLYKVFYIYAFWLYDWHANRIDNNVLTLECVTNCSGQSNDATLILVTLP